MLLGSTEIKKKWENWWSRAAVRGNASDPKRKQEKLKKEEVKKAGEICLSSAPFTIWNLILFVFPHISFLDWFFFHFYFFIFHFQQSEVRPWNDATWHFRAIFVQVRWYQQDKRKNKKNQNRKAWAHTTFGLEPYWCSSMWSL